jgi:putative transposase
MQFVPTIKKILNSECYYNFSIFFNFEKLLKIPLINNLMALVYREWAGRKTTRLKNWNYAAAASYFITICTRNRIPFLGEIFEENEEIKFIPSLIGKEIKRQWLEIPIIRPEMNITLGVSQVMPDHFHGIITIGENDFNKYLYNHYNQKENPLDIPTNFLTTPSQFGPISNNLPSIIRGFKGAITKFAIENIIDFKWQNRYYEYIIKSKIEYQEISEYIIQNPENWASK